MPRKAGPAGDTIFAEAAARRAREKLSSEEGTALTGRELALDLHSKLKPYLLDQDRQEDDTPTFVVVGGVGKCGIYVRKGEGLDTRLFPTKLLPGTRSSKWSSSETGCTTGGSAETAPILGG